MSCHQVMDLWLLGVYCLAIIGNWKFDFWKEGNYLYGTHYGLKYVCETCTRWQYGGKEYILLGSLGNWGHCKTVPIPYRYNLRVAEDYNIILYKAKYSSM